MVCKDCENKPLVRGISQVVCVICGKSSTIMSGDFNVCNDCSDEYARCKRCGRRIVRYKNAQHNLKVLYDSENTTIDLLKNSMGLESIRISYFQDGHWVGESWVDDVLSQKDANFRKSF